LFRKEESILRRKLIESDLLECVLGLGAGLFYNSPMEAVVVILRARKAAARCGKVLFINAVQEFARERAQSFLRESHQEKILQAYHAFTNQPGFTTVADLDTIVANEYNLGMPLYVAASTDGDGSERLNVDLETAVLGWRAATSVADNATCDMISMLRKEAKP